MMFVGGSCVVVRWITCTILIVGNLRAGDFCSRPNPYSGKAVKKSNWDECIVPSLCALISRAQQYVWIITMLKKLIMLVHMNIHT